MKILLFTDCLGAGGAQRQLVGLAEMLHSCYYKVKVCTYHNLDFYKSDLDNAGVPNEVIQGADIAKKRIVIVNNYFKKENPDIVIAYQETPSLVAAATKLLGRKFYLIVSERNTTQSIKLNERVRFTLYRLADVIVPNSYTQGRFLANNYRWMQKKIRVIPNFVDTERFAFVRRIKHDTPEIIVVATIRDSKNTIGLIKAASLAVSKGCCFHISWYGKSELFGDYYNDCNLLIKQLGVEKYISLLEKTKNIEEKYNQSDFMCLPSFYEGTPNAICEAISTGLPVICSDVCDNGLYVRAGINGMLFSPEHPEEIANCIEEAVKLSQPDYYACQTNSRYIAENKLSKEVFIQSYLDLINKYNKR